MALWNDETFLLDKDFLRLLDLEKEREVFAKIIALDFDENPIEEINGKVTQGSVSVDGTSSVRRTCSLSLVANELNIHDFYWGLKTKFKLYIGLKNTLKTRYYQKMSAAEATKYLTEALNVVSLTEDIARQYGFAGVEQMIQSVIDGTDSGRFQSYPDICYFKMGTYVISSFNTSQSTSQYTVSLQGKDKMSLLNGEMGGIITSLTWDFGKIDEIAIDGSITKKDYLIKDIILESVHEHAQDPYWSIIINDLDDYGLELLEYRGNVPLYLLFNTETNVVDQMIFDLSKVTDKSPDTIKYDHRISQLEGEYYEPDEFEINGVAYTIIKAEYGDVIGYRTTDLTYAGDLISNVGESVTSMLDKIKSMLGEFEYFYDLDGRFVFQRKKNYVQSVFSPIAQNGDNEIYIKNNTEATACVYSFENGMLVTSFSNNPDFANLKNDYSLWGVRKGISGVDIPIHLRYAIDTKPWYYEAYDGQVYITKEGREKFEELKAAYESWIKQSPETGDLTADGKVIYKKVKIPDYYMNDDGTSDWWDLRDWANYYFLLSGEYPQMMMRNYSQRVPDDLYVTSPSGNTYHPTQVIDLSSETGELYYGVGGFAQRVAVTPREYWSNGEPKYTVDWTREESHREQWFPTVHGNGCSHLYQQFVYLNTEYPVQTLIYKPTIPASEDSEIIEGNASNVVVVDFELSQDAKEVDWRELIYQMSLDYNKFHHDEDFLINIDKNNTLPDGTHLYLSGHTGYEQYYIDLNGFWRDLYDPTYVATYNVAAPTKTKFNENKSNYYIYVNCQNESYNSVKRKTLYYYNYRSQFVALTSAPTEEIYNQHPDKYYYIHQCGNSDEFDSKETYYTASTGDYNTTTYWNNIVIDNPEGLNFWFDFLDTDGQLGQYKVCKIGDRTKAANDTNIKSIYFRDVPTVIFVDVDTDIEAEKAKKGTGYTYIKLPDYLENMFSMSGQGKSAMDVLNDWLYTNAYCAESISINALPVYYLEPNTRILIKDDNSGINGEYIITRITFPLTHNGTMNLSAVKATENLY